MQVNAGHSVPSHAGIRSQRCKEQFAPRLHLERMLDILRALWYNPAIIDTKGSWLFAVCPRCDKRKILSRRFWPALDPSNPSGPRGQVCLACLTPQEAATADGAWIEEGEELFGGLAAPENA